MRKTKVAIIIMCILIVNAFAYARQLRTQKIYWQNQELTLSDSIINEDGVMYVPIRELFEKMNKTVTWKEDDQTVYINHSKTVLDSTLQQNIANTFKNSLTSSTQGTLDNSSSYRYIAKEDFSDTTYEVQYDKYFEERNMSGGYSYNHNLVQDAETAVKLAQIYWNETNDTAKSYDVLYDFENSAWIVCDKITSSEYSAKGPKGLVISSYDGQVIGSYGAGQNNTTYVTAIYGTTE